MMIFSIFVNAMSRRMVIHRTSRLIAPAVMAVLGVVPGTFAQDGWTGSIGAAYIWQSSSGNEDAFRSQLGLREGFLLDELALDFRGTGGVEEFNLDGWGFGNANPSQTARLGIQFRGGIGFEVDYDQRNSFFALAGGDLSLRSNDWDITRWKASLFFDGWEPVAAALIYRKYHRDGTVNRPYYGLNELYPASVVLDESMDELTLWLGTRTLPVKLELEQSLARYERANRPSPGGQQSINGTDPDLLDGLGSTYRNTIDVPTTRFTASYGSRSFEGVATVIYADSDFDSNGAAFSSFAIGGGDIGTISFMDELVGSAQMENLAAAVNLGFRIADRWTLRLDGNYRDATTDANLLGARMVRSQSPLGGGLDLSVPVDDEGRYETTDQVVRATVQYRAASWGVWVGGLTGSRDVRWDDDYDVTRDTDGWFVGGLLDLGRTVDVTFEYSMGDFQRYVFRTDPQDVNRAVLKLRSQLGKGWKLNIHGIHEKATNPSEVADLDWKTTPYGVGIAWASGGGHASAGMTIDLMDLTSRTGLVLPSGQSDVSLYDTDVMVGTLYGSLDREVWRLSGSTTYLTDDGSTWPLQSWNVQARVSLLSKCGVEYGLTGEYWSYNEDRGDVDDYDVTRYGLFAIWRFQ